MVRTSSTGIKSGLVGIELDSQSKDHGFKSHPIDGNSVKAIDQSIPVLNVLVLPTVEEKENTGAQLGHT